jgi:hypothetical protein
MSSEISGWLRQLEGERLEVFLKVSDVQGQPDRKIRASGPEDEMFELVMWFEGKTGMRVNHPVLPRRTAKPIPGQTELTLGDRLEAPTSGELSSHPATVTGDARR